jgi:hypothetical protein
MTGVPGPGRRLLRNRPRLVAVALLAVTALAASVLQSTAAIVLQQTLDEHWRGAYDLLVTQAGRAPDSNGYLRSDALTDATSGRLSLADLDRIRALPGVDVAAPIAEVAFADSSLTGEPVLWLPVPVRADASLENPQAFRITVTGSTHDGLADRDLATESFFAFAYQPSFSQIVFDATGAPLRDENGQVVYATTELADSPRLLTADTRLPFVADAWDPATGTIALGLVVAPRPVARIALVDPVAERELLGEAGAFLDPLIDYQGTANPIVRLEREKPIVSLSVTVEEFDSVQPGAAGAEAVEQAQGTGFLQNGQLAPEIIDASATHVVSTYDVPTATLYDPFAQAPEVVGEVGAERVAEARAANRTSTPVAPRSIVSGRYTVPEDATSTGVGFALHPRGYATFGGYAEAPISGDAAPGSVAMYSKLFGSVGQARPQNGVGFEVVGEFSVDALRSTLGEADFMPLGSYDVRTPSLLSGAGPAGARLATSTTGFGIPGTNQLAIGSLDLLNGWNVERPISAIRIRVEGTASYGPEAQQRLLQAASALAGLGYTATIVAGSSPQRVPVEIEDYALSAVDDQGRQVVGTLGLVEQSWSRLGAVAEVQVGVSATAVALLAISVVSVGVLLAVVQLGSVPARRVQAGVLRELGWQRRRIARWLLAEEAIALLLAAVVGAVAVAIASVREVAAIAVGVSLLLVVFTSLVAVGLGARAEVGSEGRFRPSPPPQRRPSRPSGQPAPHVRGVRAFGFRQARVNLANSASLGLAMLFIVLGVAVAVTLVVQARAVAGPSELAALASARSWVPQGLLVGVSLGSGIALAVLSRRMGMDRRSEQWSAIRAMGWTRREVVRAHVAELAVSAAPGVILGLLLATAFVLLQVPQALVPVLVAGGSCGVAALAVVLLVARRVPGDR